MCFDLPVHPCGRDITSGAFCSVGPRDQIQVVRFGFYPFPQFTDQDRVLHCCADQAGLELGTVFLLLPPTYRHYRPVLLQLVYFI